MTEGGNWALQQSNMEATSNIYLGILERSAFTGWKSSIFMQAKIDRELCSHNKEIKQFRMTKTWFNSMLHQVETARHDVTSHNKLYGIQPNGKLFPAFDIHRHGLAAAYLLNRKSQPGDMFSKVQDGETCTKEPTSNENLKSITDGISDIKIVNKEFWRPLPRYQRTKKFSNEEASVDLIKKKSISPALLTKSKRCDEKQEVEDKIEEQRATAEMELTAKSCIESCPEFKLLFVPGYEVEEPDEFYEDPFKFDACGRPLRRTSDAHQDPFTTRVLTLRKLDDETTATEDRQKRFENFLCPSRYSGTYRDRKISTERRLNTARTSQSGSLSDRSSTVRKARIAPQTPARRNRVVTATAKKDLGCVEGIFDTAKSSHQKVVSDYKALTYICDRTSSEDTDSLQSSEPLTDSTSTGKKPARNARRRRAKCNSSPDLKPSRFYDVTEIAATYNVPCDEKMKDTTKKRKQSHSPGKSFFSQRKNSLTKAVGKRPATAEVRKKKTFTPKRPNTAIVDTRKEVNDK